MLKVQLDQCCCTYNYINEIQLISGNFSCTTKVLKEFNILHFSTLFDVRGNKETARKFLKLLTLFEEIKVERKELFTYSRS
jgi:hypothetical protein